MKKTMFVALLALAVPAFPATKSFHVSIHQNSTVEGKAIKAGDYKLKVENGVATFQNGKEVIAVPAKEEMTQDKAESNELGYSDETNLQEIRIGGSKTKIVFNQSSVNQPGM